MVKDKVVKIFTEHLGVDAKKVVDTAHIVDDLGADSLDEIELIMAFEEEFLIEIKDEEAEKIKTVGDAIKAIEALVAK